MSAAANLERWSIPSEGVNLSDEMPDYGHVVRRKGRKGPEIDFYPEIKGRGRYLCSYRGTAFESIEEAERVRILINSDCRSMSLPDAIDRFRGPRSQKTQAWHVCEAFLEHARKTGSLKTGRPYAGRTVTHYTAVLNRARPFIEGQTFEELTRPKRLAELKAWYRNERGLRFETEMANAFIALKAVARFYAQDRPGFRVEWPPLDSKTKTAQRNRKRRRARETTLTLRQVAERVEAIPERRQVPYWLLFFSQRRLSEIRGILGVDCERPRVFIGRAADGKQGGAPIRDSAKTDEDGWYPMPEFVWELIERHCTAARFDPAQPLVQNDDPRAPAGCISDEALRDGWDMAGKRLEQTHVPLYRAMKGTGISGLLDAGVSEEDVLALTGHTERATLDIYDRKRETRRQRAVTQLDELRRK